ncbi:MAG: xylulokinase [Verrucomicrobia bacterium]|nr:xylulokinase [Verrucomicrobiota bacterium]
MADYFIGIDSGTQSTKAIVVDARDGRVVGAAAKSYGLIPKLPAGHKEQHPKVWIDAVAASVRGALKAAKVKPADVRGIGVSGQQHGFVPLDQDGNVIRPAKLWCDTSTAPQCAEIIGKLGGLANVIAAIGNGVPAGFTASKILWLKQNEPKNYARLATVLLPHDYINYWLTGAKTMEFGDASGTALMDVRSRQWSDAVINAIDPELKSKLPVIQPSDQPAGTLRAEAAKKLGLTTDVLVSAGGGDNMMGAIGTGNTRPGIVTASFGTSGTIYACSGKPVVDPQGEIAAFCDSTGQWLPLLCTMNVTVATEMVRKDFGWTVKQFDAEVGKAPVGAGGLVLVPYFEGERTPNVPDGTGVFFGVNERTFSAGPFARAAMEGATLGMNYGLNRLRGLGIAPTQIRATGGGSNSAVWRQVMADIFNAEVVCTQTAEGAAYGGALQAMWCYARQRGSKVEISEITDEFVKLNRKTIARPKPKNVELYRKLQELQDQLSRDLRASFAKHRALVSA